MRYLILGSCGMAGHMIAAYLEEKGHCVTGVARRPSPTLGNNIICDAKNTEKIKEIISGGYDYVINCFGILNQAAENNKSDAVLINSFYPHFLAYILKDSETKVVHLSTDCVFSGENAPYYVDSFPDGKTFYDRSKALGELNDNKNVTLRGSIVGPDINANGIGLLNWFMKQNSDISGFTNAIWTGQTTLQLAKTIETVTLSGISGLYNTVPERSINKYELLKLFNKYLKPVPLNIIPKGDFVCDKTLIQSDADFCKAIPGYEEMISELAVWIKQHKEFYPDYYFNK